MKKRVGLKIIIGYGNNWFGKSKLMLRVSCDHLCDNTKAMLAVE